MTVIAPSRAILAHRAAIDAIRRRWPHLLPLTESGAPSPGAVSVDVTDADAAAARALQAQRDSLAVDWYREQTRREAVDRLASARRWEVVVDPGDGRARRFYLNGPHARVLARARALFESPDALVLTPLADVPGSTETIDSGLNLNLTTKGEPMKNVTLPSIARRQAGFTLIELMIVVAIIGLLAAIALPAMKAYTVRAQVTEAINMLGGLKAGMVEFHDSNGGWPTTNEQAGIPAAGLAGKYVGAVNVSNGALVATFRGEEPVAEPLRGLELAVGFAQRGTNAADASPNVVSTCGLQSNAAGLGYVFGTADNAPLTSVPADLLPSTCK